MSDDIRQAQDSSRDKQGRFTGGEAARAAGHKGGKVSSGSFDNDRQRAREAGRKGGKNSHGGGRPLDD